MKTVFLHIPKCAGTSLRHELEEMPQYRQILSDYDKPLSAFAPHELDSYDLICGHFSYESLQQIPGPKRVITMLRNPTDRVLSTYHYWRGADVDLEWTNLAKTLDICDFLKHPLPQIRQAIDNTQVRFLASRLPPRDGDLDVHALQKAQKVLSSISFGTVEFGPPDGFGLSMAKTMNKTKSRAAPPKEAARLLARLTKWDWKLYNWATQTLR